MKTDGRIGSFLSTRVIDFACSEIIWRTNVDSMYFRSTQQCTCVT